MNSRQPWETWLTTCGEKRLANFARALILTNSTMTCSFRICKSDKLDPYHTVHFIVNVPVDQEETFEKITGCKLDKVPRLQVGMTITPGFPYKGAFANKPGQHRYY